jgi:hypothetical protein
MKKTVALIAGALLALPAMALAAQGIIGDCADCHTMHNSQQGANVAQVYDPATGTYSTSVTPLQNLLKLDCIACHASPDATSALYALPGGSIVPQVAQPTDANLAGGNFRYSSVDGRKGHNVIDLTAADASNANQLEPSGLAVFGAPPGMTKAHYHGETGANGRGVFTTGGGAAFDAFTCAGARGCHGTRSQLLSGSTVDNGTDNVYVGTYRTGIAAVSGAHHNSFDGAKTDNGYTAAETPHSGATIAAGYRFIPGLKAYGNEAARWKNVDANSHNEYFATDGNTVGEAASCGVCHNEGHDDGTGNFGLGTRMAINSSLKVPGNDMSGFCATCHGVFHSAGTENGTSGAFLRHPSDWVIPSGSEYAAYTSYDITAPVARPSVVAAADAGVAPGTDMVMCLSCHAAHATEYDYMLRGDYTLQTAGGYGSIAAAQAVGFCQACHTTKGVLPENR